MWELSQNNVLYPSPQQIAFMSGEFTTKAALKIACVKRRVKFCIKFQAFLFLYLANISYHHLTRVCFHVSFSFSIDVLVW